MWSGTFEPQADSARNGWTADWYFTDRRGGVSRGEFESLNLAMHVGDEPAAVAANRTAVAALAAVEPERLAVIKAEHGAQVHTVAPELITQIPLADGLISTSPNVALMALAADCVPVVLADVEHQVVGVVHCGWRGVVAGVVPATVERMVESGALLPSVAAVVGPAICSSCYVVDAVCAQQVATVAPGSVQFGSDGNWRVDVAGAVVQALKDLGIRVRRVDECTFTNPELFSYRRDHTTGRHGALVVLRAPGAAA